MSADLLFHDRSLNDGLAEYASERGAKVIIKGLQGLKGSSSKILIDSTVTSAHFQRQCIISDLLLSISHHS